MHCKCLWVSGETPAPQELQETQKLQELQEPHDNVALLSQHQQC
ncbi:hypothetical protein NUACC26_055670 [Scytonema sp. NUACC26]